MRVIHSSAFWQNGLNITLRCELFLYSKLKTLKERTEKCFVEAPPVCLRL